MKLKKIVQNICAAAFILLLVSPAWTDNIYVSTSGDGGTITRIDSDGIPTVIKSQAGAIQALDVLPNGNVLFGTDYAVDGIPELRGTLYLYNAVTGATSIVTGGFQTFYDLKALTNENTIILASVGGGAMYRYNDVTGVLASLNANHGGPLKEIEGLKSFGTFSGSALYSSSFGNWSAWHHNGATNAQTLLMAGFSVIDEMGALQNGDALIGGVSGLLYKYSSYSNTVASTGLGGYGTFEQIEGLANGDALIAAAVAGGTLYYYTTSTNTISNLAGAFGTTEVMKPLPNGDAVFGASLNGGSLYKYDHMSGTITPIESISGIGTFYALEILSNDNIVFATSQDGGTIFKYDMVNDALSNYGTGWGVVNDIAVQLVNPMKAPVLVITNNTYTSNPFGSYLTEILQAEGITAYQQIDKTVLRSQAAPSTYLSAYQCVLLAETSLDAVEEQLFRAYVSAGGILIAMRPDPDLSDLFGLSFENSGTDQILQYFAVSSGLELTGGLFQESLQYHGQADNYSLNGATALAYLYSDISTPSACPAVSMNSYGQGKSVAFTFDLSKSVILTRHGNPEWKDSEGDGMPDYRPTDMFCRSNGDRYFCRQRIGVPQADEKQRILANLIIKLCDKPLPRMWYLPGQYERIVLSTGDGEDNYGSDFDHVLNDCASYEGVYTVYLRDTGIANTTSAKEASWRAAGHETGIHFYDPYNSDSYNKTYDTYNGLDAACAVSYNSFKTKFGHDSRTCRNHTIDWSGWIGGAEIEARYGVRLDTNYYNILGYSLGDPLLLTGYFTGSGLPQRFITESGRMLPIYQLLTEWPEEPFVYTGQSAGYAAQLVIDQVEHAKARGYYSAFVINAHPLRYNNTGGDITHDWTNILWSYCQAQGIPLWSAEMLLDFVEARNNSHFDNLAWQCDESDQSTTLSFNYSVPASAGSQELTFMIPAYSPVGTLSILKVDGTPVSYTLKEIKGIHYGLYTTVLKNARVEGVYAADRVAPVLSEIQVFTVDSTSATITWQTDEPSTSRVIFGITPPDLFNHVSSSALVTSHSIRIENLASDTQYYYQVISADYAHNEVVSETGIFTTQAPLCSSLFVTATTIADFAGGLASNIEITDFEGGELSLAKSQDIVVSDDFDQPPINTLNWSLHDFYTPSGPYDYVISGGEITVSDYTCIYSNQAFHQQANEMTLEGYVTLSSGSNAHFGFADALNAGDLGVVNPSWAIFTSSGGVIYARSRTETSDTSTPIAGVSTNTAHWLKVILASNRIEFHVDGQFKAVHEKTIPAAMRVWLSSYTMQPGIADVIYAYSSAYLGSGSYVSPVFDKGEIYKYKSLSCQGSTPPETAVNILSRTSINGSDWSVWEIAGIDDQIDSPAGRFIQYRCELTTSNSAITPQVDEIIIKPTKRTDLNQDFNVNFLDFVILAQHWMSDQVTPAADIAPPAGDGLVNIDDLTIFAQDWTFHCL